MSQFFAIFVTVFLAELGDKTQLATLLFATERATPPMVVFLAAAGALIATSAIAVLLGTAAEAHLSRLPLKLIAGIGFIVIGMWTVYGYFTAA